MISNSGGGGALSDDATSGMGGNGGANQGLKKGPWTTAEDAVLVEYVKRHGEGNWNSVQKNSGLSRCGKSCRLRWANHLRPNLKKGAFSPEEERLIVELHAKLGNKWARMAAQLPGRTDNEIKNYWNTRVKRRQRAGLPLYPQGVQKEALHQQQPVLPHSSSSMFSPFLSSPQQTKPSFNPTLSLFDQVNFTTSANPISSHANSSFLSNPSSQFKFFPNNNAGYTMPLSPVSPFQSSMSSLYNHSLTPSQLLSQSPVQFNSGSFDGSFNLNQPIVGSQFHPIVAVPGMNLKLPASPSPLQQTTSASSGATGDDYMISQSTTANTYVVAQPLSQDTSGLLDDMLKEAETLSRNENSKEENCVVQFGNAQAEDNSMAASNKGKHVLDGIVQNGAGQHKWSAYGNRQATPENQWADSCAAQAHAGMKRKKEQMEEIACMDDDLLSLLDWHHGYGDVSIGQLTNGIGANMGLDHTSPFSAPAATTTAATAATATATATTSTTNPSLKQGMESCEWYTMPSIC